MRRRLACLAAVLALLVASACSDDDGDGDGDANPTTTSTTSTTAPADGATTTSGPGTTAGAATTVELALKDFSFEPKELAVAAAGTTVRLVNQGGAPHTFTVDSLDIDEQVAPGSTAEVQVRAPAGQVQFYCRFHQGRGMEGTLRPA